MDPIDYARRGDSQFFKQLESKDDLVNLRDGEEGDSVLSIAVNFNHLYCCIEIFKKCPSLLYQQSTRHKYTTLHHAGWLGELGMVKFLIDAAAEEIGGEGYKKLFRLVDVWGATGLHKAVIQQHLEIVKLLIEKDHDKELLRMADVNKDTALHLAVKSRNFDIVKVLIEAHPQFEYRANNFGETPLTLTAMSEEEAQSLGDAAAISSGKIRKLILEKQPSNAKVRIGDNGWTSLHHATCKGDLSAVEDILLFCPECSELVNNENQNCC